MSDSNDLQNFQTGIITAADGARIGYRKIGAGPGMLLVHGALQSSLNFTDLARHLAGNFTVYIPDRRGRGLTDPYTEKDNLLTEANDICTLARQTGTTRLFGLSSGAIIVLQAALLEPALKKIALYEPPIPENETTFQKLFTQYEKAMSQRDLGRAFVAIIKGAGDASFLTSLPTFMLVPLMNRMIKAQAKNTPVGELPLKDLIPTFTHDRMISTASMTLIEKAKNLKTDVLLLGGSKSQKYLKQVLDRLSASIPHAKRVELDNVGHLAADNTGSPKKVANELIRHRQVL